ncbi:hypothetical protein Daus18300_003238 [Diaporthe australafricana]|uniref:Uncharacterized protein n=1 Tax=Diaporthe australafricana TaxID=127596 RepID=A0ABR3XGU4_9PEZI
MESNTIILVAHGDQQSGVLAAKNIKAHAKSGSPLSFDAALKFMNGDVKTPIFPSASVGTFEGLSDQNCKALFKGRVFSTKRLVNTTLTVPKGEFMGSQIWCLNGQEKETSIAEISVKWKAPKTVILLSCRGGGPFHEVITNSKL